jgi:hypothetical protein
MNGRPFMHRRGAAASASGSDALVVIDQEPLRSVASAECVALMGELEQARAEWHRFEREDKPGFVRWRAREFGPLLSQLRDIEVQIRDREALVREVELEMRRGFYDPFSAYQRVMFRRTNPALGAEAEPEPASPGSFGGSGAGPERKMSEFEQEALFQEWVHRFIGTNPDKLDDEAYETTFAAFKTHMFRGAPTELRPSDNFRREQQDRRARAEEPEEPESPADTRLKELYRLLVRRLHPDLRADGSAAASALWHEVQEAYAATDVAQLEILLALSDITADRFSGQTSVSQMRALVVELERALFALHDSLRQARGDDAWNFARAGAAPDLRVRVDRDLRTTLRVRTDRLNLLIRTITDWSTPVRSAHLSARR